jgi:hypothetical protein
VALDPQREVARDPEPETTPPLFRRPSDPPPRLDRIMASEAIHILQHELSLQHGDAGSPRRSARYWARRFTGRSRRRLLVALGTATVALAEQCDRLADRAMTQEEVTADVAGTLGQELTRLRAEVLHLAALVSSFGRRPDA